MPQPQYGIWRAHGVIARNGTPVVVLEFPDGNYVFDRDTAMTFALSVMAVEMCLFPTAGEFCDVIRQALDRIDPPAPAKETAPQRANGSRRARPRPRATA